MEDLLTPKEREGIEHIRDSWKQYAEHEHGRDDFFCLNLTSYMGERTGALLALIDRLAPKS
jgi:hypothetical protein